MILSSQVGRHARAVENKTVVVDVYILHSFNIKYCPTFVLLSRMRARCHLSGCQSVWIISIILIFDLSLMNLAQVVMNINLVFKLQIHGVTFQLCCQVDLPLPAKTGIRKHLSILHKFFLLVCRSKLHSCVA